MLRLLTLDEAANELGVPPGSLRTAAQQHGLLIKMGRAVRIDPNALPELIRLCQDTPKDHGCTDTSTGSGASATMGGNSSQRALETAEKLKSRSRGTSPKKTDQTAQRLQIE